MQPCQQKTKQGQRIARLHSLTEEIIAENRKDEPDIASRYEATFFNKVIEDHVLDCYERAYGTRGIKNIHRLSLVLVSHFDDLVPTVPRTEAARDVAKKDMIPLWDVIKAEAATDQKGTQAP